VLGAVDDVPAGGEAGMEKPTTEEVGRAFLVCVGADVEDAGRRRDAHDFLGGGIAGVAAADAGSGVGWLGAASSTNEGAAWTLVSAGAFDSGSSTTSLAVSRANFAPASLAGVPATETEVLVVVGDPGTVGVYAVSVAAVEGTVEFVSEDQAAVDAGSSSTFCSGEGSEGKDSFPASSSTVETAGGRTFLVVTGETGGEGGGVLRLSARSTISGGGRAREDMMMLGACEGS
jgi:hypothetical protein